MDKKFYMDNLQLESAEYDLISSPNNGVCLFKSGADSNLLDEMCIRDRPYLIFLEGYPARPGGAAGQDCHGHLQRAGQL